MSGIRRTTLQVGAGVAALLMVAAACGDSSGKSSSVGAGGGAGSSGTFQNQIYAENTTGTPKTGGTLTMLGVGDVDNSFDPNYAYYTVDYQAMRMYERNLYIVPAVHGQTFTLVPDLATDFPKASNNGLKYTVTLREGVMWNTDPPRQVTAADVVRGVKRSCNPTAPFAGQADFADILAGYQSFFTAFSSVSATSAPAQKQFIDTHNISGVSVDPSNDLTVDFTLTKPAAYFTGILSLGPFNPAPVEYLNYLPISNDLGQHTLSDGPYQVKSYSPGKSIVFVRNPVWDPKTDPIRKAYVNEIHISETGNQQSITQQIQTNTPQADMMWGHPGGSLGRPWPDRVQAPRPLGAEPGVQQSLDRLQHHLQEQQRGPGQGGGSPGVVLRHQPGPVAAERRRPTLAPAQTHIIAGGTLGATPDFDLYPFDPTKAKQMLQAAGFGGPGQPKLTLKYLYRPASITSSKDFQTVQANMAAIGVTLNPVTATNADFYAKDLSPGTLAKSSGWDLAEPGWGPDWYPTGNKSMFLPILDGRNLPPNSSNFGYFNDPKASALYDQALTAPTLDAATKIWQQADREVKSQAPLFPITNPNQPMLHNNRVHNCIYIAFIQNCDATNIWLS